MIPAVASAAVDGIFIAVGVEVLAAGNPAVDNSMMSPLNIAALLLAATMYSLLAPPLLGEPPIMLTGTNPLYEAVVAI